MVNTTNYKPGFKKTKLGWIPEDWEYLPFSKLCDKVGDGLHSTPNYVDNSNYFFINGNNLVDGVIKITGSTKCVSEGEYQKHRKELGNQTILLSINGTIGNTAFYNEELVILGKSAAYLNVKDGVSKEYLSYQLQTHEINSWFYRLVTGSTIKNLGLKEIKQTDVPLPPLPEQKKIARIISTWDKAIAKLEQLIDEKEQLKKGLMQQLLTGKKRFPGFTEEWKEVKLGEVAEIVGGGTPDTQCDAFWNGDIQWFTPTDIKSKYIDNSKRTISSIGLKSSSARLLPKGTLLFTSRATIGDVGIATTECSTNQGFQSLLPGNYNADFIYYWLIQNNHEFVRKSSGSTFLEISKKEIQKVKIKIPSIEEQYMIGQVISKLDHEIYLLKTQLENNMVEKKGLMQKLLTGEVRVKTN